MVLGFGGIGLGLPAFAQQTTAEQQPIEVIAVSGIRGSLIKAMDSYQRSSDGIVDAISAEDIGKFPDTNLAESLQRISGVSIDRVNGEGSRVSVRGFGPDFNLVTLNGRRMRVRLQAHVPSILPISPQIPSVACRCIIPLMLPTRPAVSVRPLMSKPCGH